MGVQCISIITMPLYSPISPQNRYIYISHIFLNLYILNAHIHVNVYVYIYYIIYLVFQNLIHVYNLFCSDLLSIPSPTYLNIPFHHIPSQFHIFSLSFFFYIYMLIGFIQSCGSMHAIGLCTAVWTVCAKTYPRRN